MADTAQLSLFAPEKPFVPDLASYDWIVVNSSAGKDSLVMQSVICGMAEEVGVLERVVVVHADLGRVEWQGTRELAEKQAQHFGVPFVVVRRRQGDLLTQIEERRRFPGPETRFCTAHHKTDQVSRVLTQLTDITQGRDGDLLQQVEERGMWPDPKRRYCTSDQKRAPISRLFTALTTETRSNQHAPAKILNCMGMRADESSGRAKKRPFKRNDAASNGRRLVDDYLPLHKMKLPEVWEYIDANGLRPLVHYAYALGMPRLSCVFCIFMPKPALVLAGKHNRPLLKEYVAVEQRIDHRFRVDVTMADVLAAVDAEEDAGPVSEWAM